MENQSYYTLLKFLLLHPFACPANDFLPKSNKTLQKFLEIFYRNRLTSYFYHFAFCKKCKKEIPSYIRKKLRKRYENNLLNSERYTKQKKTLTRLAKKYGIRFFLLKDNVEEKIFKFYSDFFYELKYDLDVFIGKKDFKLLKNLLTSHGFDGIVPVVGNSMLPDQMEFKKKGLLDIEVRKSILTSPRYREIKIINETGRKLINKSVWKNIRDSKINYDPTAFLFIRFLIYFFDDCLQGLKNLFDLWIYLKHKEIDWKKIQQMLDIAGLTNFFSFIVILSEQTFGKINSEIPSQYRKRSLSKSLSLILFKNYYIHWYPYKTPSEIYYRKKAILMRNLFFIICGLLQTTEFKNKLLFLLKPKRFILTVYFLLAFLFKGIQFKSIN